MAEDTKPPTKRDFKFDILYFAAAIFAVRFVCDWRLFRPLKWRCRKFT